MLLFSRYLQQLVMESLGKRLDLDGKRVDQGISVYGNKGSTDQHAYVQQLRDGVNNFFVTFIRVLEDGGTAHRGRAGRDAGRLPPRLPAWHPRGAVRQRSGIGHDHRSRGSMPATVGALIALFERAVGFYATLVNINAYHQPGVEAGKKAAAVVLDLQGQSACGLRPSRRPPSSWPQPPDRGRRDRLSRPGTPRGQRPGPWPTRRAAETTFARADAVQSDHGPVGYTLRHTLSQKHTGTIRMSLSIR